MIEINLLPEDRRKKQELFKGINLSDLNVQNVPVFKIAAAVFGALVLIQILLFFIGVFSKSHLARVNVKYNSILPQKNEADKLKAEVDLITKKTAAIDDLMVNRFSWANKLSALNDAVVSGVWLSELFYEEKAIDRPIAPDPKTGKVRSGTEKVVSRYLVLAGYALNTGGEGTALVGRFIKSLKDSSSFYSSFSNIELGAIRRDRMDNQEVMNFRIVCLFKADR